MSKSGYRPLQRLLAETTRQTLSVQQSDGSVGATPFASMVILSWAICYDEAFEGNPYHGSPDMLSAIMRLGDHNCRSVDDRGHYSNQVPGWDEWRSFTWMEAMERLRSRLDAQRLEAWGRKFIGAAMIKKANVNCQNEIKT